MRHKLSATIMAALLVLAVQSVSMAEVPGAGLLIVPGNSDATVSLSLIQRPAAELAATAKTANSIAVAGPLTVNQYANVYYVRMTSGAAEGRWSTIASNTATELVLADTSFLASVNAADTFKVIPHHTLASVFPNDAANITYRVSTALARATEVLLPGTGIGTNKASSATFYYQAVSGVSAWRKQGASGDFGATVLPPQSSFIIRNNGNGVPLTVLLTGFIPEGRLATTVARVAAKNDILLSTGLPVSRTLRQLNLGGTSAFATSTALARNDELLVFDNAALGKNKAASATYYYQTVSGVTAWRKQGTAGNFDNEVLPVGAAILLRKVGGADATFAWRPINPN